MPVLSKYAASPISILSKHPASPISVLSNSILPQAILVSGDSSPAHKLDILLFSQAPYWPHLAGNNRVSPSFGSHPSVACSAQVSHSFISTHDLGIHYELVQLYEQCKNLQSENTEVKNKNTMLKACIDTLM